MDKYSVKHYYSLVDFDLYLKSIINIGYNNKHKGPSFVWYKLSKGNVNKVNIKKRLRFKPDYRIKSKYRAKKKDYKKSGYDKGHLARDASFDYNLKALKDVYRYSNAVPQKHFLNAYIWGGLERYGRFLALRMGYVYIVNIIIYGDKTIGKDVGVPKFMYKVMINKKNKFLKIFKVRELDINKGLKRYEISYSELIKDLKNK